MDPQLSWSLGLTWQQVPPVAVAATVAAFVSVHGTVEVAVTLQLGSRSEASQPRRLLLFPCSGSGEGAQELRAANEKEDPVPGADCVTHLRPGPVASIRIIPLVFALRSLMERRGGRGGG